ncbi:OmpA family protein [Dyella japonica]|uniref:OmpA family protein n=1 Tax=Dyella japonica TaxID=231455 RepID=UPI0009E2F05C|nr:OmpA family protein [Dyella japonica]
MKQRAPAPCGAGACSSLPIYRIKGFFFMCINLKYLKATLLVFATSMALTACGNVSKNVHADGQSADELVWPKVTDATPMHKGGTFPNRNNLALMHAGLNKHQVADLIGFPHFSEGVWSVREWNYVFHFRDPVNPDQVTTCQYKVLFDDDKIAKSFYWSPSSCSALISPPATASAPVPAQQRFDLSGDTLFPLGRYRVEEILPGGQEQLNKIASQLRQSTGATVQVIGHTDILGNSASNLTLSQNRAMSVRSYLISHGVSPASVSAVGVGETWPVKKCNTNLDNPALIACLQPNRRVEIVASGFGASSSK